MNLYRNNSGVELAQPVVKRLMTSICFFFFVLSVLSAYLAFKDLGDHIFQFLQKIFGISLVGFILSLLYLFHSSISDQIKFHDDNGADS